MLIPNWRNPSGTGEIFTGCDYLLIACATTPQTKRIVSCNPATDFGLF